MLKKRQEIKWTLDSEVIVNHIKYDRDSVWYSTRGHFRIRSMDYLYLISVLKVVTKFLSGHSISNEEQIQAIQKNHVTVNLMHILKTEVYYRNLINKQNE
tara:strand:+ start:394 stop:693 length:300 start_codon:yes stop_codon:yes gene_type:complete